MKKIVLIYSGGLDSTSLLYRMKGQGNKVSCLGFDYGQRHVTELKHAETIAKKAGVDYQIIDLSMIRPLLAGSSQTDSNVPVPEGKYNEPSMKKTVVPNRNMIMLSLAAAQAISIKADWIAYAAHSGDHTIYPDCRPDFVDAMNHALTKCDWHKPILFTPYLNLSKGEVLQDGIANGAPVELTWSCYKGGKKHCGKCGACTERKEAFEFAKAIDPTKYED